MEFKNREDYENSKIYFTEKECPFCSKQLNKTNKILFETNYWTVVYNKYPYFGDKDNLLSFPKRHIEFTYELNDNELLDIKNVEKKIFDFYNGKDYFSFLRQTKSNKSIEHIHYHYLVGKPSYRIIDSEKYLKIKI